MNHYKRLLYLAIAVLLLLPFWIDPFTPVISKNSEEFYLFSRELKKSASKEEWTNADKQYGELSKLWKNVKNRAEFVAQDQDIKEIEMLFQEMAINIQAKDKKETLISLERLIIIWEGMIRI
jgi:hypothetical protein